MFSCCKKKKKQPPRFNCPDLPMIVFDIEERVVSLINKERKTAGLKPVKLCCVLDRSSNEVLLHLLASNKFSHVHFREVVRPEVEFSYSTIKMGEILAKGYELPEDVTEAWMKSDSHRRAILFPRYKYVGISCVHSTDHTTREKVIYWVVHFAY